MAELSDEALVPLVDKAFVDRKQFILANLENLSMKILRQRLEEDLKLPAGRLGSKHIKSHITKLTDEVIDKATPDAEEPRQAASGADDGPTTTEDAHETVDLSPEPPQKKAKQTHKKDDKQSSKAQTGKGRGDKPAEKVNGKKSKSTHSAGSEDELDDVDEEDVKKPKGKGRPAQKVPSRAPTKSEPAKMVNREVEKLKTICKNATIRIAPNVYIKNRTEASLIAALKAVLSTHGLSISSDKHHIERVKKKLTLQRDMEGIDTENIIMEETSGSRRPRRSAAEAAIKSYREIMKPPKLDDSDEDEDEDEEEDNEASDDEQEEQEESAQEDNADGDDDDGNDSDGDKDDMPLSPEIPKRKRASEPTRGKVKAAGGVGKSKSMNGAVKKQKAVAPVQKAVAKQKDNGAANGHADNEEEDVEDDVNSDVEDEVEDDKDEDVEDDEGGELKNRGRLGVKRRAVLDDESDG